MLDEFHNLINVFVIVSNITENTMLFIKLEYHNVFHHTSYIYTYKVNPIVLQWMRAIIDILQGRQVLTDGLSGYKRPGQ